MSWAQAISSTFSLRRKAGEVRGLTVLDEFAGLMLVVAAVGYLYFDTFGGVIRWVFPMAGLTLLAYAPAGIAILALLAHAVGRMGDGNSVISMTTALVFSTIAILVSLLMGRNVAEILFAIYIWIPFFVGAALAQRRMQDRVINAMIPLFFIATAGVLINIFVNYPWVDATYEVLGVQKEAARDWKAYGVQRLSGLSRASYTAAAQILICYCALEYRVRPLVWRSIAWVAGIAAIHYTTSKSPELAMAALPVTYLVIGRLRQTDGVRQKWGAIAVISAWLLVVFAGPLLSLPYGTRLFPAGVGYGIGYSSFADRVLNTWPNALRLVDWRNPAEWLVGAGLGGIGSPQTLFHADIMNPGDNMAVYLMVSFGLLSLGFVYLIFRGGLRAIEAGGRGRRDFAMIVAVLGIGSMANVIESIFPVMVLGMICARQRSRRAEAGLPIADLQRET